ncbi:MAG: divalent metal cation transporter [Acidobacteriaceae bacterium]|nr:divalent metal cation transporter [Acidobacteriaceae bacterium]
MTIKAHGVTDIQTSSQAADALRPIAGLFAFTIFALGIVGAGMLAVPVPGGSVATPSAKPFAGASAWRNVRRKWPLSTPQSQRRSWSAPGSISPLSIRSRP